MTPAEQLNNIGLQHYTNSTEVLPALTVEDITKACLIGRLNLMLLGETGEGKTQLENDILGIVRNAKEVPYDSSIDAVLDAAYLVGTHSGVLHPSGVDSQYDGNPYRAMDAVIEGIRSEFTGKQELLREAVSEAQKGKLIHEGEFTGRWQYASDLLTDLAREAKTKK